MGEPALKRYSFAEYRQLEAASVTKNEYFEGYILAMAGGTPEHSRLAAAVITQLENQLEGKPWAPQTSDMRIRIPATGLATYPDVSVVCGPLERDPEDADSVTNPVVIVEVLSKFTEAYDRGEKFYQYRQLASLQHYVLVSSGVNRIEHYERTASTWALHTAGPGAAVVLTSIGCTLSVDAVYRGVERYRG